ncbi:MAG: tRNA pseudouridine(38-40) synthase TruA [Pseudomonadota bacterium]|nr:tRNA pseudouridine(38-40) synthase TruA [Pseudomonadota bacterium]MEC8664910.1 tRNA pseudouridine(38-40) synthase TruA [Pseudomonadota bacterium]
MAVKRWKLTIEYRGTDYCGWQRQEDGLPTIQQSIEDAIYKFCQKNITTTVAGRTDAGVHATGQVLHMDLDYGDRPLTGFELLKAINAHMRPQPISVIDAEVVADDFNARFDAINKLYRYRILQRPAFPAIEQGLVWHVKKKLDVNAMQEGAKYLLGKHDFTTFRDSQCQAKSPVRTLDRLEISAREYDISGGREIIMEAEAQSFLHHQIRNFIGTLALVGEGKWQPEDVKTALEKCDRTAAGPTAPSDGLYLVRVDY